MSHRKPHTVQFKAGERNIFFHLLTACNLSCAFCYINPVQHGRRPGGPLDRKEEPNESFQESHRVIP